jgi:anti-anti-sigma factor
MDALMTVGPRKETWRPAEPEPDGPRHSAEVGSDGLRVVLGEGLGTPEGRLVSLAGELDAMAAPHLLVILEHVLRDRTQPSGASELRGQRGSLQLDLRALSFIDCGGLRALQRAANLAESQGGTLWLWHTQRTTDRLLDLLGLPGVAGGPRCVPAE